MTHSLCLSQWTEPPNFDGAYEEWMPRPAPASTSTSASSNEDGLSAVAGNNGWSRVVDEEGYTFFYHEATGVTQWEQPEDF